MLEGLELKTMEEGMSGIELINRERQEQIEKHGRTVELDALVNSDNQLSKAVITLLEYPGIITVTPKDWDKKVYAKMTCKNYKERLIICGALLAAEIDRLQFEENNK